MSVVTPSPDPAERTRGTPSPRLPGGSKSRPRPCAHGAAGTGSVRPTMLSGTRRRYGPHDLARLEFICRLTQDGIAPAEAARIAAGLGVMGGSFFCSVAGGDRTALVGGLPRSSGSPHRGEVGRYGWIFFFVRSPEAIGQLWSVACPGARGPRIAAKLGVMGGSFSLFGRRRRSDSSGRWPAPELGVPASRRSRYAGLAGVGL